jgi:hypothetical protein
MAAAVVETSRECAEGATRAGVPSTAALHTLNSSELPVGCWLDGSGALYVSTQSLEP